MQKTQNHNKFEWYIVVKLGWEENAQKLDISDIFSPHFLLRNPCKQGTFPMCRVGWNFPICQKSIPAFAYNLTQPNPKTIWRLYLVSWINHEY